MSYVRKQYQVIFFSAVLMAVSIFCPQGASGDECTDDIAFPPFVAQGVDANLLMILDNSASMYDLAYVPPTAAEQGYCNDESYNAGLTYTGYFGTNNLWWWEWYIYNPATQQFESTDWWTAEATYNMTPGTKYYLWGSVFLIINEAANPDEVVFFAANSNFLNWAAASKFDVEKKVLTGGKYNGTQLVMESRGCMEKTFVKQIEVVKQSDNSIKKLALGIISESDAASNHLTKIEVYNISANGFRSVDCETAIDLFSSGTGNLGNVKMYTSACLDPPEPTGLMNKEIAFNHIMQECWYFNQFGNWQPGAGTIGTLKIDCQNVYNINGMPPSPPLPNEVMYLAQYAPEVQELSDVCYGKYGTSQGYVGRCWEPTYSSGAVVCSPNVCTPGADLPTEHLTDPTHDIHSASRFCDSGTSSWVYCNGNYNNTQHNCKGSPGQWAVEETCAPAAAGSMIVSIDWTDDVNGTYLESGASGGSFTDANDCVDQSLQKWCANINNPEIIDPSDSMSSGGTTYNVPATLIDFAVHTQLGDPILTMKGLVEKGSTPTGLLHDYASQIRMGAMAFNQGPKSECAPMEQPVGSGRYVANLYDCLQDKGYDIDVHSTADTGQRDGARIISYIGKGSSHTDQLVSAINDIEATTWTPTAEAYYSALGYYTQNDGRRLHIDDYLLNSDYNSPYPSTITAGPYPAWTPNTAYAASDWTTDPPTVTIVRDAGNNLYWTDDGGTSSQFREDGVTPATEIGHDTDVAWNPFDPVVSRCQKNNILILTDGASTADQNPDLVSLATSVVDSDEASADAPYSCVDADGDGLLGSTLLDDLAYYGLNASIYPSPKFTDTDGNPVFGNNIRSYLVSTGTLRDVVAGLPAECDSETLLTNSAENGYETDPNTGDPLGELYNAEDPNRLEYNLRKVFNDIRAGTASGSAASVIASSRSGEGAIYQALFFTSQTDSDLREINWAGDVHSLWLDKYGNIREDCGDPSSCADPCDPACDSDQILDLEADHIITFYTDSYGASLARRYSDSDGNGEYELAACSDGQYTTEATCTAAGETWDYSHSPDYVETNVTMRELRYLWSGGEWLADIAPANTTAQRVYSSNAAARYIFTWLGSGDPVAFTTGDLRTALVTNEKYYGYLKAADVNEADNIVKYIRGDDQSGNAYNNRSRLIDWYGDGTPETYKLGDVVHSTPTIVARPAEDYDVIYGDTSYRLFRKQYGSRRVMVYAGGNDGGLHAFNGGWYDRSVKEFLKAPPGKVEYDLGAEMWMYIPHNLLPHLNCLTDADYDIGSHKYYVDLKPKIFDAKIFDPEDGIHAGGWGTILVGGMRFGGGDVGVDTNGDAVDDETMRSAYFILDITNPECPPVVLAEFTHADLGFSSSYPTAIPLLKCTRDVDCPEQDFSTSPPISWPMDWYLAIGSGPQDAANPQVAIEGRSDQKAKMFILKLGGTDNGSDGSVLDFVYATTPQETPAGSCPNLISYNRPSLVGGYPREIAPVCDDPTYVTEADCTINGNDWEDFSNSFFSDLITVDFDLSFQADTLYVGSTADTDLSLSDHTGGLHRFVIDDINNPATWDFSTFLNVGKPVTAAPAVAYDGQKFWLYFGTGRFLTREDKTSGALQSFYGVKEQDITGAFDLTEPSDGDLVDVSSVWVEDGTGTLSASPSSTGGSIKSNGSILTNPTASLSSSSFAGLLNEMVNFDGWKIDFDIYAERNVGQAAVLGNIVSFTTYVPSNDLCTAEGTSYLWTPHYKTGTAFYRSVIGLDSAIPTKVLRKISLGRGLSTTPNIHSGKGVDGTKAFVQTSTGAILGIKQDNPGVTKSGTLSWRELLGGN